MTTFRLIFGIISCIFLSTYVISIPFVDFCGGQAIRRGHEYDGKHLLTLFRIWLLSPIYVFQLIGITIKHFLLKWLNSFL